MFEDIYNQDEEEIEDFEFDPLDPVEILKEARDEIIRLREENEELWGDARRMARSIKEVSDENPDIIFPGLEGEIEEAPKITEESLAAGIAPLEVVKEGAVKAMDRIGEKWRAFEIFLSHVMLAAEAMKGVMNI